MEEIDSTNSELKRRVKLISLPEGALLYCDKQPQGRGQQGARWESAPFKNFTGTFYLKPKLESSSSFVLSMIASLAARETISNLGIDQVTIKWPNDILVNGKKIVGILVENSIKGNTIEDSFIGFGININQREFSSFDREATSVAIELNQEIVLEDLISNLSIHLQQFYMLFKTKGVEPVRFLYLAQMYLRDEWSEFGIPHAIEGRIIGITQDGLLALETRSGKVENFNLKEIRFIR